MKTINIIKNRIYADYLMPSRLPEYEKNIKILLDNDYEIITVRDYYHKLENNSLNTKNYFINRHDIDTDTLTAKEFFKIEKKYGVKATYYFRLSTLDFKFMKELEKCGSEASYHFEEIATYCKEKHIKDKGTALKHLPQMKEMFKKNFLNIEKKVGRKLETVCSHGDFVNRALDITNNILTQDILLRKELGIKCETYDDILMKSFEIYIADRPHPVYYYPKSIFEVIGQKNIICMLSHPRQWKSSPIINSIDNIKRVWEAFQW